MKVDKKHGCRLIANWVIPIFNTLRPSYNLKIHASPYPKSWQGSLIIVDVRSRFFSQSCVLFKKLTYYYYATECCANKCRVYQDPPRARDQEVFSGQRNKNTKQIILSKCPQGIIQHSQPNSLVSPSKGNFTSLLYVKQCMWMCWVLGGCK